MSAEADQDTELPYETSKARSQRWLSRGVAFVSLVVVLLVVVMGVLLYPSIRDDWRLDGIVQAVALDWRDFGYEKAQARLEYELDHGQIGLGVRDDSCVLNQLQDGSREVTCAWSVSFRVPFASERWVVPFGSRAVIGPDGQLQGR